MTHRTERDDYSPLAPEAFQHLIALTRTVFNFTRKVLDDKAVRMTDDAMGTFMSMQHAGSACIDFMRAHGIYPDTFPELALVTLDVPLEPLGDGPLEPENGGG